MIVRELIEKLQHLDPDLHVFVSGYEGGCEDINIGDVKDVALNVNEEWYYGKHEFAENVDKSKYKIVKGIVL
jgi:hypothetical protein